MLPLAPDLWTMQAMLVGRVYVLADEDGLTVVDAGPWGRGKHLLQQLTSAGFSPSAIKRVVLTHDHADHIGGLNALLAASRAELVVSPIVSHRLSQRARQLAGSVHVVTEGTVRRDILSGVTVLDTPGHKPGHISLWQPERGLLIAGDAVMTGALSRVAPMLAHDRSQLAHDLERLSRLAPQLVLPGHGHVLRRGAGVWLAARAAAIRGAH